MKYKLTLYLTIIAICTTYIYIQTIKNSKEDLYNFQSLNTIEKTKVINLKGLDENNLININEADKEILKTLPFIGETIAKDIIYYRENISKFKSIEDIKKVKRIGEKTYEKIKNLITIN